MTRTLLLITFACMLAVSCGGDGDTADPPTDGPDTSATATNDSSDASGSNDGGVGDVIDGLDFGDGQARVTVGDVEYEFSLGGSESADGTTYIGTCQELFGLIAGNGFVSGNPEVTIEFEIPPPDWDTYDDGRFDNSEPRIEIELGDEGGWAADLTLATTRPEMLGQSQIDEWTLDGGAAVGTATFIEMESFSAPVEGATPVAGSFEIGCGDG